MHIVIPNNNNVCSFTAGVICAAPMMQGWYRAQVVEAYPDTDECVIRFLDYGGYARIEGYCLRQIRSDYMSLPFQAVECYLINLIPLPGKWWSVNFCKQDFMNVAPGSNTLPCV